jgi:hypothetical protein
MCHVSGTAEGQQLQQQQHVEQQQQQQQPLQEPLQEQQQLLQGQQSVAGYLQHCKVVRVYCAADSHVMQALNTMNAIALGCMTATDSNTVQQQHTDRQQLLEQYIDAEAEVMTYCAGNSAALNALHSMSSIAYKALT